MDMHEFEKTLTEMSRRSKAFELVKAELLKRGIAFKKKPRGRVITANLKKKEGNFTVVNIRKQQVLKVNEFGDTEYDG